MAEFGVIREAPVIIRPRAPLILHRSAKDSLRRSPLGDSFSLYDLRYRPW